MSSPEIIRKVRKNPDYIAATRELDRLEIAWDLCPPIGKGHPYLFIGAHRYQLASSPRGNLNSAAVVANLRRWLKLHGFSVD